jgi:DNA uptake protein ComE-like DNA-binding protein
MASRTASQTVSGRMRVLAIALVWAALFQPVPAQAKRRRLVDINRATVAQLQTLPGIRGAYAQAIAKNRPYRRKTQLLTRGILPVTIYDRIQESIIARQ